MSAIFSGADETAPSDRSASVPFVAGLHSTSSSKRAKLSNRLACQRCRQLKARCEPGERGNPRCARCTRLKLDCRRTEPDTHTHSQTQAQSDGVSDGRPRQASTATNEARPSMLPVQDDPTDRLAMLASAAPPPLKTVRPAQHPPQHPSHSIAPAMTLLPQTLPQLGHGLSPGESSLGSLREESSPQSSLPRLSMVEFAQAKERALEDLSAPSKPMPALQFKLPVFDSRLEPDPIDMHILCELDAVQLFEHYHTRMNGFVILLDPFLHTLEYVRASSPVLFVTILAVSAKFARPQLYGALLQLARQSVGRCIIDHRISIGLVQSLVLQVYWKEPDDCSAWLRIGEAIRMAYQLHLHKHRVTALPENEFEARLVVDRERTWIDLCAIDHTFFLQSGEDDDGFYQTCMIPNYRMNVQSWLKETRRFGVEADLEQGANFEWIKTQRLCKDIHKARPGTARSLGAHVQATLDAAYSQYLDPRSPDVFPFESRPWIRVNFWLAAASLALERAMLTAIGIDGDLLAKWVVASDTFVDAFEVIARHGYIKYWQDILGITLYSMGEFSVKILPKVHPATQGVIVGWMERIYRASDASADGHAQSTAAFISRFFHLCLRAVSSPAATAPATPQPTTTAAQSLAPSSLAPLDPGQEPLIGFQDASYWESIFPGLSTDWSWLEQSVEEGARLVAN